MSAPRIVELNLDQVAALTSRLLLPNETLQVLVTDDHVAQAARECDTYERLRHEATLEWCRLKVRRETLKKLGLSTREVSGQIKAANARVDHWELAEAKAQALWLALVPHLTQQVRSAEVCSN